MYPKPYSIYLRGAIYARFGRFPVADDTLTSATPVLLNNLVKQIGIYRDNRIQHGNYYLGFRV